MKGLLAKDFALLMQRKRVFLFLAAWAVVMSFTMEEGSFVVSWMAIIGAFFAISSLAYDEYDNCLPFLMSLPIERKTYAKEKYLFGFLCGFASWLFAFVVYVCAALIRGNVLNIANEIISLLIVIPAFVLLIDFSLPINIKFGSEKGRIVVLVIWAVVFGALMFLGDSIKLSIPTIPVSMPIVVAIISVLAIAITFISLSISSRIMDSKEF